MNVLQLVNTPRSFFDKQVETLEAQGVDCTTLTVPGTHDTETTRSPVDYLRYYPDVLTEALDGQDVIHAHYGLLGPIALAQPTCPVVLHLWGSDLMGDHPVVPRVTRFAARYSDAVIVPSQVMATQLSTAHRVIPWGVDTDLFRPIDRDEAREHVGWDTDDRIVLFPYPPERDVKNHPLAERVVDEADVDAQLRVLSGVPYEDVPYYMNASDAVLVTSKRESGPMVIKEAAACNVPVVSTDVGFAARVLDEVTHAGVETTQARLADRLSEVLSTGERSNGRERIDGLSLSAMGEEIRGVYRQVLDGSSIEHD